MQIDFWSDIVCPYCALTDNRLRLALERFGHADEVRIVHRSFQVHPDLPREGITQRRLLEEHGITASRGEQIFAPIERAARAEGLEPFHALERTLGPTGLVHELLALADDLGRGGEVWTAAFRAHFGQGRELWTREQVLDFAVEAGLDREEAAGALREGRYRARVAADQREAERLGARGIPFLTLDGAFAVHGAVGVDELLAAITRAWDAAHPEPVPLPTLAGAADACGPDGCAVPRVPAP
ncbi:DsbA family oxidoreductase [Streptomyces sp. NPDC005722]